MTELYSTTLFEQYEKSKTFSNDYNLLYESTRLDLDSVISIYNRYKNLAFDEKVNKYTVKYSDLIYRLLLNQGCNLDLPDEIYWECVKHCLQYNIAWACANSKNVPIEILNYIINEGKERFPNHLLSFTKDQLITFKTT